MIHWVWGAPLGGFGTGPVRNHKRLKVDWGSEHSKKRVCLTTVAEADVVLFDEGLIKNIRKTIVDGE